MKLDAPEPGQKQLQPYSEQLCNTFEPTVLWDDLGIVSDVIVCTDVYLSAFLSF